MVTQAISDTGIEAVISKVEDIQSIMNYGVTSTPALVIDGAIKAYGRLPSTKELAEIITNCNKEKSPQVSNVSKEDTITDFGSSSGGCC